MKLHDDPETDSLYIEFNATPSAETGEIGPGLNIDLDERGALVGLVVDHASQTLDLTTLDIAALPFRSIRAA